MTEQEVHAFVVRWQRLLQLERWKIEETLDAMNDEGERPRKTCAGIWRSQDYYTAKLYFGPDWREWTREFTEQTVVHELLHLETRRVELILDQICGQVNRDAYSAIRVTFEHHLEGLIDHLAWRLVELVPDSK